MQCLKLKNEMQKRWKKLLPERLKWMHWQLREKDKEKKLRESIKHAFAEHGCFREIRSNGRQVAALGHIFEQEYADEDEEVHNEEYDMNFLAQYDSEDEEED